MWIAALIVLVVITVKCLGYWIGLLVIIRWMEMNNMPQPSDRERAEITEWILSNILEDLRKRGRN